MPCLIKSLKYCRKLYVILATDSQNVGSLNRGLFEVLLKDTKVSVDYK